jgi:hypothetical protein
LLTPTPVEARISGNKPILTAIDALPGVAGASTKDGVEEAGEALRQIVGA